MKWLKASFLLALVIFMYPVKGVAQNKLAFSIPFKLVDNRPYIDVVIKQHTYHFILDCGAINGIDLGVARELGLDLGDNGMQSGVGAKQVRSYTTVIGSVGIGPKTITGDTFFVTDFSPIKNGLKLPWLDGVIGYGFMKDYAVQFDYANNKINFYSEYKAADPVPFELYRDQIPFINVTVDGLAARVIFDTGDRTAFTLFNHFAEEHNITKSYPLTDTTITGYGIGGPVYARTFKLKQLAFGKLNLSLVPTRVPMMKTGGFAQTDCDGSIGGGVLKAYKFTIDYKTQKLYLQ